MSLVAYASSDSEQSDTEDIVDNGVTEEQGDARVPVVANPAAAGEISDSDSGDEFHGAGNNVRKNGQGAPNDSGEGDINVLLKALPEPKYDVPGRIEEDDELEDEVKPKATQVADAPKPPPKKTKQPVKITIPSLDLNSDEEDEPSRKKSKTSNSISGKSGLFALLPPPMHAAKKETNRLLVPHSLTKKTTQVGKKKPESNTTTVHKNVTSQKTSSANLSGLSGYSDSDDDEEASPSSFFALESEKLVGPMPVDPSTIVKTHKLTLPPPSVTSALGTTVDKVAEDSAPILPAENSANYEAPSMDAPLSFKPVNPSVLSYSSQNAPLTFKSSHSSVGPSLPYHSAMQYPHAADRNYTEYGQFEQPGMEESMDQSLPSIDEPAGLLHDEEFLRLQGKKQRGKEEINIIDVNADDFISTVDVHKTLSEEQPVQQSHKKNDGPTSQQKRKHQITYLAHQAKERELSLKNQWAQNRMTKRQTQAKYGF